MRPLSKVIFFFVVVFTFSCAPILQVNKTKTEKILTDFKINNTVINPLVVYSFIPWASDRFSYWQEIDLTAANEANRFYLDSALTQNFNNEMNANEVSYSPQKKEDFDMEFSTFSYTYLGSLENGVQLIYFQENSTGSTVLNGLLGFTFSKRKVTEDTVKHVFMRLEKSHPLQQYCTYEIDKEKNRVKVIPQSNMMQADFSDTSKKPYYVIFNKDATEALKASLEEE